MHVYSGYTISVQKLQLSIRALLKGRLDTVCISFCLHLPVFGKVEKNADVLSHVTVPKGCSKGFAQSHSYVVRK